MTCPIERGDFEVLLDYCAGRLGVREVRTVGEHVEACAECSRTLAAQKAVWTALEAWEEAPISAGFNRRLYSAIEKEEAQLSALVKLFRAFSSRYTPFSWGTALPPAAAGVAVIIALAIQSPAPVAMDSNNGPQMRVEKIDVEQVERALDDVDLLRQLSNTEPAPAM